MIDLALGWSVGIEGSFAIAPLLIALFGAPRVVLVVAILASATALAIGYTQSDPEVFALKTVVVFFAGLVAVALSYEQARAAQRAEEASLLDRLSSIGDTRMSLEETVDAVMAILVEDFAQGCAIQVVEDDHLRDLTGLGRGAKEGDVRGGEGDTGSNVLSLPLEARGRFLGVLTLRRSRREPFTAREARLARSISGRVGRSLDNAGLFDEFDSLSRRLDTVVSLLSEGVYIVSPAGRLLFVNETGSSLFGVDIDGPEQRAQIERALRNYRVELDDGTDLGDLSDCVRMVLDLGLYWSGVIRLLERSSHSQSWFQARVEPIEASGGDLLWAVMTLEDITPMKEREVTETILGRLGEIVAKEDDLARALQRFAETVVPNFADCCWLYLPSEQGFLRAWGMAHRDPARLDAMRETDRRHPIGLDQQLRVVEAQKGGSTAVFEVDSETLQAAAEDDLHLELMRKIDNHFGLVVALRDRGEVIGVLAFGNGSDSRRFTSHDAEIAELIGERSATIISNARKSREVAEITKILELDLRPAPLIAIPGLETAEIFESGESFSQVGGDFYEALESSDYWNIVIGDVVGRGATAAALSLEARDTLRVALELVQDPELALSSLDARLRARARNEQVTVALLRLPKADPRRLLVSSAGHPLPLLGDELGVRAIGDSGPILGLGIAGGWPEVECEWRDGAIAVLYTDGISEFRAEGEMFGADRIMSAMKPPDGAGKVAERIRSSLEVFSHDSVRSDDLAAVVICNRNGRRRSSGNVDG